MSQHDAEQEPICMSSLCMRFHDSVLIKAHSKRKRPSTNALQRGPMAPESETRRYAGGESIGFAIGSTEIGLTPDIERRPS